MSNPNFIDYVKINCRSGKGGAGSWSLFRDKLNSKGGPDGGDGGMGGSVVLRGNTQLWTLLHLKYRKHIICEGGVNGLGGRKTGKRGADQILEVPLGTVAKDAETGEVLFEITEEGQTEVLLAGGRGGQGNWHFKSSTNQTPRYAQPGEEGRDEWKILELKVLADVGLVGFPNAGKSTLLSVLTAAKPEIADYPFTTLVPNLGIVDYRDYQSFVIADIPGIIEGASEGKGLGYRFLRHIERNSILLFLVPADSDDIIKEYNILLNELDQYNEEMVFKDRILAISKSDMLDQELKDEIEESLPKDVPHIFISSITNTNLVELKDLMWKTLND
ncbi:MAG: GTP-binding protein [Bacteroidia bacterium]